PGALQSRQRPVGRVGLLLLKRLKALAVEVPEALGVAPERVDVRNLHRIDLLPQTSARRAEVRAPGRDRDSGPCQRDDRAGLPDQVCQLLRARGTIGAAVIL